MKNIVGLTGLIGSGKSLAATYFKEQGVTVIDTDAIAHGLTRSNGLAVPMIRQQFGDDFIDGSGALDRKQMRDVIFADDVKRQLLERILHPLIFDEVLEKTIMAHGLYVIVVVPLLFRAEKYLKLISRSIFVDCDKMTLIKRVIARSSLSAEQVESILEKQVNRSEQIRLADDILDNNGSPADLCTQVVRLHAKYNDLFKN